MFVTAGPNLTYVGLAGMPASPTPSVCVHTFPLPFELWANSYQTGLHLVTVGTQSIPDQVIDPRIKHRSRLHWHLAAREARQVDPQAMAILSDGNGQLTETATGNLCVVDGSTIFTPATHVLKGTSVEFLGELASSLGIGFVHAPVTAEDLEHADEAFFDFDSALRVADHKIQREADWIRIAWCCLSEADLRPGVPAWVSTSWNRCAGERWTGRNSEYRPRACFDGLAAFAISIRVPASRVKFVEPLRQAQGITVSYAMTQNVLIPTVETT